MGALKRSRSLDLLCFILPVMFDHLEPSCVYNRSLQTGDWMMCGLYSWWRSIRITLWFDLKLAPDPDTVRSRPKPFICSIMYRSFYTFHLKHLAKGKRQTLCITCKEPGSFPHHLQPLVLKHWTCLLVVLQIAYILAVGRLASRLKWACIL